MGADGAVTAHIDKLAEDAALTFLEHVTPRMNILSEEVGYLDRGSRLTAIVDPIDATNNALSIPHFTSERGEDLQQHPTDPLQTRHVFGFPYYAFSVGVLDGDELVAGCVRNLPTGEIFTGARGHGVELDGNPVAGSGVTRIGGPRVRAALIRPETQTAWRALTPIMTGPDFRVRLTGCSALDLALIACGSLDALINPNYISPAGFGEKVVDYAGALALLDEMGGVLTGFDGTPIPLDLDLTRRTPLLAAATPELHAALIEILHQEQWDVENP